MIRKEKEKKTKRELIAKSFDGSDGAIYLLLLKLDTKQIKKIIEKYKNGYGKIELIQDLLTHCGYDINLNGDSGLDEVTAFINSKEGKPLSKKDQIIFDKLWTKSKTKRKNDLTEKKIFTLQEVLNVETIVNEYWKDLLSTRDNQILKAFETNVVFTKEAYNKIKNDDEKLKQKLKKFDRTKYDNNIFKEAIKHYEKALGFEQHYGRCLLAVLKERGIANDGFERGLEFYNWNNSFKQYRSDEGKKKRSKIDFTKKVKSLPT